MGKGYRPFGYILASHAFDFGASIPLASFANLAIEPELCLLLGSPLHGVVDVDKARSAVSAVLPAFELNEVRYLAEADDATILADGCGQWGIVEGSVAASPSLALTSTTVELWEGAALLSTSTPGESMDDPFLSLARLSANLDLHGRALQPGDRVITGSFARAVVTAPGDWKAVFRGIGEVSVRIT